jgi:hypothetical protein
MKAALVVLMVVVLLLLTACSSGADYLRTQREAVGIPHDYRVDWCAHDHAAYCNWDSKTICINRAWLWQPSMFIKGVLVHEYCHTLGYSDHSPLFVAACNREADRIGIPRWAVPRNGEINRLEAMNVYAGSFNRHGVGD